jgi:hypothetical protein
MPSDQFDARSPALRLEKFQKIFYGFLLLAAVVWCVALYVMPVKASSPDNAKFLRDWLAAFAIACALIALCFRFVLIPKFTVPGEPTTAGHLNKTGIFNFIAGGSAEAVAISGFALGFLTGARRATLPFFAASALLLILFLPRKSRNDAANGSQASG